MGIRVPDGQTEIGISQWAKVPPPLPAVVFKRWIFAPFVSTRTHHLSAGPILTVKGGVNVRQVPEENCDT
jgi:hypothetical protein